MLSLFVLNALAEAPPTTTYTVAADSRLAVLVSYDRSAIGGGHDHVIAPNKVTGTITWNVADSSARCLGDLRPLPGPPSTIRTQ